MFAFDLFSLLCNKNGNGSIHVVVRGVQHLPGDLLRKAHFYQSSYGVATVPGLLHHLLFPRCARHVDRQSRHVRHGSPVLRARRATTTLNEENDTSMSAR